MRPEDLSRPGAVADYYDSLDRALASLEKLPGRTDGRSIGVQKSINLRSLQSRGKVFQKPGECLLGERDGLRRELDRVVRLLSAEDRAGSVKQGAERPFCKKLRTAN